MPKEFRTIRVGIDGAVATVTLDRPQTLNAFDAQMRSEVKATWLALQENDDVSAVILTGAGERAFCSGIDRDAAMAEAGTQLDDYDDPGNDLGPKSCGLWKPVIAAVNGICCGGALYFIAECDIIIAAEHATFFDPHVTYGMAAVYEPIKMTQRMPLGEVLRMTLLGNHEQITAETAQRIDLVSEIVPIGELAATANRIAQAIASQPPQAVQASLRAIWAANDLGHLEALKKAPEILAAGTNPEDLVTGQALFESGNRPDPHFR